MKIQSPPTTSDGIATALEVLGPGEGYRLAVERGWAALFVVRNADGTFRERLTPAFTAMVEDGTLTLDSRSVAVRP